MEVARQQLEDQAAIWNGASGHAWVDLQALIDEVLRPFEDLLAGTVVARGERRVLDGLLDDQRTPAVSSHSRSSSSLSAPLTPLRVPSAA